jgi:hypothetical protein
LNLLSPRSKRRANYRRYGGGEDDDDNDDNNDNDNDNKGGPRKTLVTAMIRRESDASNANVGRGVLNGPTMKFTDMYLSLTF